VGIRWRESVGRSLVDDRPSGRRRASPGVAPADGDGPSCWQTRRLRTSFSGGRQGQVLCPLRGAGLPKAVQGPALRVQHPKGPRARWLGAGHRAGHGRAAPFQARPRFLRSEVVISSCPLAGFLVVARPFFGAPRSRQLGDGGAGRDLLGSGEFPISAGGTVQGARRRRRIRSWWTVPQWAPDLRHFANS